jgi:signal transduction histidine kinase/CheY-like chemotaxis protein
MSRGQNQKTDFPTVAEQGHGHPFAMVSRALACGSLRSTILFWFLVISLAPVIFVSLVGYNNAKKSRLDDFSNCLLTVSEMEKQELSDYLTGLRKELTRQAKASTTVEFLTRLDSDLQASGQSPGGWIHSNRWTNIVVDMGDPLHAFRNDSNAQDILLANSAGDVVFSCGQDEDLGTNLLDGFLAHSKLEKASRLSLENGQPGFTGYELYQPLGNQPIAFHLEPVRSEEGDLLGLIIMAVGVESFYRGFRWQELVGPESNFYVVNESLALLGSSSQKPGIRIFEETVASSEILHWQHTLKTHRNESGNQPVTRMYESVPRRYVGFHGKEVLGVVRDLEIMGIHYALVLETPRTEILAGLKHMSYSLLIVILVVGFLVVLAGLFVAYRAVDPINQLGRVMQRVADGHEVWAMPNRGPQEVRRLTEMFHCMINKLTEAQKVNERQYALKRCQFELNEKLRGEPKIKAMAGGVLEYLGNYFGAQMGVFYLLESRETFGLASQFGVHDESVLAEEIRLGQGVLGQVAAERMIRVLRGVTEERHKMSTGLAQLSVNTLILVPIHLEGKTLGILELGLLADVNDEDLELVRLVVENVAVAIKSGRSRERVHRLLKETWNQTAALSRQQKELQDSNRQLERAGQYKSEFLANMSHELRTPLNSLLIMSQVLVENRNQNLSRQEVDSAQTIYKAGSDLLLLINDILDLSRVEAGKLDLCFEEFNLTSLVEGMNDLFHPLAQKQGVNFRTVFGPALPENMVSDPLRLTQILKNILNNAFKFTEKGEVTFRIRIPAPGEMASLDTTDGKPWLVFSISDTGQGMNGATLGKIFEVFNQGDGSIGRRYGGSGLGLSISSKLCEMLGGQLRVDSVEGKGSTFSLFLPVTAGAGNAPVPIVLMGNGSIETEWELSGGEDSKPEIPQASEQAETEREPISVDLAGRTVLLCDDDMRSVFQITEILDDLGAVVILASSWAQGIEEAQAKTDFDFALVNPTMADRPDGEDIKSWKIECGGPSFPVLALIQGADDRHCAGADFVGTRPVDRWDFVNLVKKATEPEREIVTTPFDRKTSV